LTIAHRLNAQLLLGAAQSPPVIAGIVGCPIVLLGRHWTIAQQVSQEILGFINGAERSSWSWSDCSASARISRALPSNSSPQAIREVWISPSTKTCANS